MPATELRVCEHCQRTVMGVCLCIHHSRTINREFKKPPDEPLQHFHALWRELHTTQDATPSWFADWCNRVPGIACGCRDWLRQWITENPPRFDDWFTWTWELHVAVNRKLNKPDITLDEAKAIWLPYKQP